MFWKTALALFVLFYSIPPGMDNSSTALVKPAQEGADPHGQGVGLGSTRVLPEGAVDGVRGFQPDTHDTGTQQDTVIAEEGTSGKAERSACLPMLW